MAILKVARAPKKDEKEKSQQDDKPLITSPTLRSPLGRFLSIGSTPSSRKRSYITKRIDMPDTKERRSSVGSSVDMVLEKTPTTRRSSIFGSFCSSGSKNSDDVPARPLDKFFTALDDYESDDENEAMTLPTQSMTSHSTALTAPLTPKTPKSNESQVVYRQPSKRVARAAQFVPSLERSRSAEPVILRRVPRTNLPLSRSASIGPTAFQTPEKSPKKSGNSSLHSHRSSSSIKSTPGRKSRSSSSDSIQSEGIHKPRTCPSWAMKTPTRKIDQTPSPPERTPSATNISTPRKAKSSPGVIRGVPSTKAASTPKEGFLKTSGISPKRSRSSFVPDGKPPPRQPGLMVRSKSPSSHLRHRNEAPPDSISLPADLFVPFSPSGRAPMSQESFVASIPTRKESSMACHTPVVTTPRQPRRLTLTQSPRSSVPRIRRGSAKSLHQIEPPALFSPIPAVVVTPKRTSKPRLSLSSHTAPLPLTGRRRHRKGSKEDIFAKPGEDDELLMPPVPPPSPTSPTWSDETNAVRRSIQGCPPKLDLLDHDDDNQSIHMDNLCSERSVSLLDDDWVDVGHSPLSPPEKREEKKDNSSIDLTILIHHMQNLQSLEQLTQLKSNSKGQRHSQSSHHRPGDRKDCRLRARLHLLAALEQDRFDDLQEYYQLQNEDVETIHDHLELCQELDSEISWDLMFQILFPECRFHTHIWDPLQSFVALALEDDDE